MKKMLYLTWVVGALLGSLSSTFAQSNRHWDFAPDGFNIPQGQLMQAQLPKEYKLARLNVPALYQELSDAYRAPADAPPRLISIPNPEGGYSDFYITPTSVVADEVAHLYTVKTFKGYAKNSRQVTLRCGISPTGFHAAVFSGDVMYVIESASRSDVNAHIVYYKSDLEVPGFRCGVDDTHRRSGYKPSESGSPKTPANLRTYRLAVIADATYRTQFGGMPYSATNVLNSMASGMNMVNAVYERDLGVHLTLVSNTACADAVLTDHTDINAVHAFIVTSSGLGSGGFDVGHSLLWLDTGGVAYLGVVCNNSFKGGGFSGANGSVTQLYVDYMAHELGHQFGGDHTFASSECGTSETNFRYETGEGSTIMAYAGVCGAAPSYQSFSDPYFHAASIAQINTYISSGGTCAVTSTPGTGNNAAPTANAQSDITIPKQTPFILVGTGSDANSDPVTFSWEQFNGAGAATTASPNCTSTTQPLFRFRPPVSNNYRVFPQMSDVLAGNNNTPAWEKLPCVARTLNFRMTSRDNNTNWGRTASDNMVVTVADTGPFDVTAPNGGQSWEGNSSQSVTWTVNGTDSHCTNVDILVSTDNGVTYSLVGTYPNNGLASITVPNTPSTSARVLVQCSVGGNFRSASTFFDVSNAVFAIVEEGCGSAYWNMTAASAASNTVDNTSFGNITQGNSNGAVTLLSATSTSSGYTGVSGGNNAAVAARTGALSTAANGSAYFEVVVTPNANTIFTLNGISFGSRSTSTGPQAYSIRTSLDNYASQAAGSTLPNNSSWALYSVTGLSVASATGTPLTIRIYGHSGTGSPTAGQANWRIDDLTINGCNEPAVVCPVLTSAPGEVQITDSTCGTGCTVSGGQIQAPVMGCPVGSSIQYNVNGGGWTTNLPTYAAGQTIQTRCLCDTDANTFSPASTGVTTVPGTCTVPAAPTGALAISNSTCSACVVGGGSIAIGTVSGTGGTLEYSTDGGQSWSSTLPTYNQTGPAQTILASVLGANGCRSNTTQVGITAPGACVTPDAPTGALAITNSTCNACVISGGSIAIGTVSGTGGTLEYSTDGGQNWSALLPMYNQTGPAQTIIASVLGTNGCRSNTTQVGITAPGACSTAPAAPTGTLAITNSTCSACAVSGGSIAIGTVSGTGGTLEYSTDGGQNWSATLPTYNQTGPAQTIIASVVDGGGCRSNTTQVGVTVPGTCAAAPTAAVISGTGFFCTEGNTGNAPVTVTITGGTGPFTLVVNDGVNDFNVNNYNSGSNISRAVYGTSTYALVSVTDANGCEVPSGSLSGSATMTQSPDDIEITGMVIQPSCAMPNGGSISLTITGGIAPFTFQWSNNETSENLSGLSAGDYDVVVTDAGGCFALETFTLDPPTGCCPVLGSAPGEVQITDSTCGTGCTVSGGQIQAPTMGCPTGSSVWYSVNGGLWTPNLPPYAGGLTIQTRCVCDTDANIFGAASTGVTTVPGTCTNPAAPTGTLAITNSTCSNCTVSGGSIAIGTVSGTGGTLEYSTDGGQNWSATLPTYNQTGPVQTILASIVDANGCRSNSTQVGITAPGACVTPAAPTGTLAITNSTCSNCTVSGGSIAIGTVNGTGGTLEYSTDGGQSWSATLPTYNQTGPAQTILASVLGSNGCRSNTTQVGQTTPGTCTTPSAPTGTLAIVNSKCSNCTVSGGSIAIGTVSGTGGTLEYSTDGGQSWSATLPTYNQTGPAQTILASVLGSNGCRSNSTQVGATEPGTCVIPLAPTGALAITNNICTGCTASGGSIAIGTVSGPGGTLEYSTNGGQNWSATLPTYNQTGPAQTIIASVLGTNGCRSNSTQVGVTAPVVCSQPLSVTCVNSSVYFDGQQSITLTPAALVQIVGGCQIQGITANPATISCTQVGQTVPVTITVTDLGGITSTCTSFITVNGLPCNWQSANVNCDEDNSVAFNVSTSQWTITSTDCYYATPFTTDELVYARRQLCGNGSITALVTGINPLAGGWAGVVMRETSDAGAKKAQLMTNLSSLHRREFRIATNASAQPQQFASNGRYWLRIVRTGNQFTMYSSANGVAWFVVGTQNIVMSSCIQVGLVATNQIANGTLTATFLNVGFTQDNPLSGQATDVQPVLGQVEFSVFPNPTNGELNLDLTQYAGKPVRIELYSLEGKLMKFVEIDEVQTTMEQLDLSSFQRGMYLVRVKSEGLPDATRKVVLNR